MQQQQIKVDMKDLKSVKCECGNSEYFQQAWCYKILPALYSPNGQEQLISMPIAICLKCQRTYDMEELLIQGKECKRIVPN